MKNKYSNELKDYIRSIVKGRSCDEIAKMSNDRFGLSLTAKNIETIKKHNNMTSGYDTRFKTEDKIVTQFDKDRLEHSKKFRFKVGQPSSQEKPIGTIVLKKCYWLKTRDGWESLHRYLYKIYHNCTLTTDDSIMFANGNYKDLSCENLVKVDKATMARLNKNHWISDEGEITKSYINLYKLERTINETRKARKTSSKE